jgi:hypothetical protein
MLKIEGDEVVQQLQSPVIYLDHWAVMRLAEDHCAQFVHAVRSSHATVLLTHTMLMEWHSVLSAQTAALVEILLQDLVAHLFVANGIPGSAKGRCPDSDLHLLAFIAGRYPLKLHGLLQAAATANQKDKDAVSASKLTFEKLVRDFRGDAERVGRTKRLSPLRVNPFRRASSAPSFGRLRWILTRRSDRMTASTLCTR